MIKPRINSRVSPKINQNLVSRIRFENPWSATVALLLHAGLWMLGAAMLARWTWVLVAPSTIAIPPQIEPATNSLIASVVAGHWFGSSLSPIAVAPAVANFKLVGIYAPTGNKPGFAVFKFADGKQRAVLLHQEITAGNKLQVINLTSVQVGQEGALQKIELDSKQVAKSPLPPRF